VPNARGQAPTSAASLDGAIYLAWQDRIPRGDSGEGTYEILLSKLVDKKWSLPVNISDRADAESLGPHLAITRGGLVHLTWVNQGREVSYSYGRDFYWSSPQRVWLTTGSARGAHIVAEQDALLHIAWDEGDVVRVTSAPVTSSSWPKGELFPAPGSNLKDVTLALIPSGGIALGWVQASEPGNMSIYESWHAPAFTHRAWLPMLTNR
jgi:hypothetical protein